ncbi:DUF4157 domain-containing protein [Streptomyces sp. NPDC096030]|uniref:eCIS core domain-containing protein n=1 Tax=Streptomyces sp. NPDC096030 TaxID=3155423 RepID=UPI003319D25E
MKRERERDEPGRPAPASRGARSRPRAESASTAPGASAPAPDTLAALQRTVGNAAVTRMVQRSSVHQVIGSRGQPLEPTLRGEMEARLGADFSDVRIHSDQAAQRSAADVGARAYTSGNHVVVGRGGGDKHTLAHELTHVIQQRKGPVAGTETGDGLKVSDPSDRFEREAEANAVRAMSGPEPAHDAHDAHDGPTAHDAHDHAHSAESAPAVQRVLAQGLPKGTAVVKHEDDADSPMGYSIAGFSFGSYLVAPEDGGKKVRVSPVAKDWGTAEGREESRRAYLESRAKELDPAALAAKQKQQDLNLGENYLSADYRRINPLLAALGEVGYSPSEIASPEFSFQAKETQVLDAWKRLAVARNYATDDTVEGWDAQHLRNTYDIFARINGVWSDFDTPPANADGQVVRGDSKYVYDSFEGILKQDENHPDGGYVTLDQTIEWPAILSTTFGDPLTHTYVAGKEVVWEFGLPEEHQGRSLGKNNASEQEMTFPVGTRINIKQVLVRKGDYASEKEEKYGKSAAVIVFADILGRSTP